MACIGITTWHHSDFLQCNHFESISLNCDSSCTFLRCDCIFLTPAELLYLAPGELIKLLKDGWHLWQLEQDRLVSVKHLHQHRMTVPFYLEVKTSSGSV